jgi:hypothetical protein
MITPSSLSALAPTAIPPQGTRVAAPAAARAQPAVPAQKPLQSLQPGSTPPRNTPRGSLLDLSV